ncbi:MAG: sulfotransferase, partial [Acidimicrobiales bacterium]
MTATAPAGAVQFLVVGSPRSGTTLVQRLACEIPGVAMPPETHFFTRFAPHLVDHYRFPLRGPALVAAVADFAALHTEGLAVDVDAVVDDMQGTCTRPLQLFDALVRHLAGPAQVWGEKTPGHLVWW